MLIEGADYFVHVFPFPIDVKIPAMVGLNPDGTYSVYINSRASADAQKKAMRQEYNHMANDDLYGDKDIRKIENI